LKPQDRLGTDGDFRPNPFINGVGSPSKGRYIEPIQDDQSLTQKVFTKLMTDPENSLCLDCGKSLPEKQMCRLPEPRVRVCEQWCIPMLQLCLRHSHPALWHGGLLYQADHSPHLVFLIVARANQFRQQSYARFHRILRPRLRIVPKTVQYGGHAILPRSPEGED